MFFLLFVYFSFGNEKECDEEFPLDIHVIIPLKNPKEAQFVEMVTSLVSSADLSFGLIYFHFGIDGERQEDEDFLNAHMPTLVETSSLKWDVYRLYDRAGDVSMVANHVFTGLHKDGVRGYFLRFNDDTKMLTKHWNKKLISTVRSDPHCNYGLAWISDNTQRDYETHSFVSSKHFDIFGYYFPYDFHNWHEDNWITQAYLPNLTKHFHPLEGEEECEIEVHHELDVSAYTPDTFYKTHAEIFQKLVENARTQISLYLRRKRNHSRVEERLTIFTLLENETEEKKRISRVTIFNWLRLCCPPVDVRLYSFSSSSKEGWEKELVEEMQSYILKKLIFDQIPHIQAVEESQKRISLHEITISSTASLMENIIQDVQESSRTAILAFVDPFVLLSPEIISASIAAHRASSSFNGFLGMGVSFTTNFLGGEEKILEQQEREINHFSLWSIDKTMGDWYSPSLSFFHPKEGKEEKEKEKEKDESLRYFVFSHIHYPILFTTGDWMHLAWTAVAYQHGADIYDFSGVVTSLSASERIPSEDFLNRIYIASSMPKGFPEAIWTIYKCPPNLCFHLIKTK